MTLQKHVLLSSHAALFAVGMYLVCSNNLASATPYKPEKVYSDTTLPFRPKMVMNDTVHRDLGKLVKPEIRMNSSAVKFVQQFIKKNEKDLNEIQHRSTSVFKNIEPILSKYDIPTELKYLAVIESELKAEARSRAGAVGMWQLMAVTARELGLKVSGKTDERKNYRRSTGAAAKYLKALYKEYGDWLLVIAAYNAGPGVINKAIKKSGSRNFWKLQHHLCAETRGHVKRYIGVHYFFENAGSETTLTKAENAAYAKALQQYNDASGQMQVDIDSTVGTVANIETAQQ